MKSFACRIGNVRNELENKGGFQLLNSSIPDTFAPRWVALGMHGCTSASLPTAPNHEFANPIQKTTMDLEDIPSGGPFKKWFLGVIVAVLPVLHGVRVLSEGTVTIVGKHRSQLQLHGLDAACVAFLFIGLGAGIYFHYFWGLHQPSQDVSQVGKLGSALVMMIALGIVVIRVLIRVF